MKQGTDMTTSLVYVVIPRLNLYPFMACIGTTLPWPSFQNVDSTRKNSSH